MQSNSIQELLDERATVCDIAALMYGDHYVLNQEFWGSPTERQMNEIWEKLDLLGYEEPITEEMQAIGDMIFEDLVNKGIISLDDEDEDFNDE